MSGLSEAGELMGSEKEFDETPFGVNFQKMLRHISKRRMEQRRKGIRG